MLHCIARWGVAKTTAEDIAREAGISRATLYRVFPGGMEVAFDALVRHEVARFFGVLDRSLRQATTLEDVVVVGVTDAARFLAGHDALSYLLTHEADRVLPALAFHRLERTLALVTSFATGHLRRFIEDEDEAAADAEWIARIVLSYAINPSPTLDLTDPANVRRFVTTYLLPALDHPASRS